MTVVSIFEHRKRINSPRRHGVTAYIVSKLEGPTLYIKLDVNGHSAGSALGAQRFAEGLQGAAFVERAAKQQGNTVAVELENGAHWPHIQSLVVQLIAESYEVSVEDVQTFPESRLTLPAARF